MKGNVWNKLAAAVTLAACIALSGCKGFWDPPASSGTTTTLTSGRFYVVNVETGTLAAYYVNAGTLTAISGSPYTMPATPIAAAISPNNDFLYVSTASGIYVYSISSGGVLTIANSGVALTSDPATSLAVSPDGAWLIEVVSGSGNIYGLAISSSTGGLRSTTEQSQSLSGTTIYQVAIAPNGAYAFVAMGASGTAVIPFTTGNTNPFGSPSTISTVSSSGVALSVAVDPSSRVFYVGEIAAVSGNDSGGVRVFNLSTLAEQSGSPYASGGLSPYAILPEAGGTYVYAVNYNTSSGSTGVLKGFSLADSSSVYTLTAMSSTFTAGTYPRAAVEDSSNQFIFVVNYGGSYDLMGYVFDSTTAGALDTVIKSSTGTDPVKAYSIAAAH